jgi:UDP-N-acetylglucosamine 2-epimerase
VKVVTVVGARPQFIKAAPVSDALAQRGVHEVMVHTGQHYDPSMSEVFFEELAIPPPAYNLGVGSGSHAAQTARMLEGIEQVLVEERPCWVVVYGDTNSTLAGALAAAKLNLSVAHVEAGLRSFDRSMPEEVNRVLVDHLSDLCLAPTPVAIGNLRNEGRAAAAALVGDVMVDALRRVSSAGRDLPEPARKARDEAGEYLLATLHRAATTDDPVRLRRAVLLLGSMPLPVVLPLHPRTKAALAREGVVLPPTIHVCKPFGYGDMVAATAAARAVVTDSGGLQKEAFLLGTPCVTLRDTTEWVETVEAGWNTLVDLDVDAAVAAVKRPVTSRQPQLYGDGRAAVRITDLLTADGLMIAEAAAS